MLLDKYKNLGWGTDEALQLVFLETYCLNHKPKFDFQSVASMFKEKNFNAKQMQQIIKCIVHDIPINWIDDTIPSDLQMNEIRRFLEDTNCYSEDNQFVNLARRFANADLEPDSIYEFRRIWKSKFKPTYDQAVRLFDFLTNNNMWHWMIVSSLETVYHKANDFMVMMNFALKWSYCFYDCIFDYDIVVNMFQEAQDI